MMRRRPLVTLLVPAKDEEAGIGRTLRALPLATLHAEGYDTEVVVLDGRSRDRTGDIAREHGARVVPDPPAPGTDGAPGPAGRRGGRGRPGKRERTGKGAAVCAARAQARGDYVVMLDADGTYAGDGIPSLLDALARGGADVVLGERVVQEGAMRPLHRVGNALLSLQASALYGKWVPDVCTGLLGFRAAAFQALPLASRGFELEAEVFALAARTGLNVQRTQVDYLPRTGRSKLAARDGLRIGWCLLRSRFAPLSRRRLRARTTDLSASPAASGTAEANPA